MNLPFSPSVSFLMIFMQSGMRCYSSTDLSHSIILENVAAPVANFKMSIGTVLKKTHTTQFLSSPEFSHTYSQIYKTIKGKISSPCVCVRASPLPRPKTELIPPLLVS